MTPEKQRITIAEACGWEDIKWQRLHAGNEDYWGSKCIGEDEYATRHRLPSYLDDLNAMHEAEKVLADYPSKEWNNYIMELHRVTQSKPNGELSQIAAIAHATAAQRAEAFLRTLGKWEEA